MGGTGAETGTDKANPALSPTTFAGSRSAVSTAATPTWAGIMSETSPAVDPAYEKLSASPLAVNPTVAPTAAPTTAAGGFNSTPYSTGELPHIGAPATPVAPAAEEAKPFEAPKSFRPIYDAASEATMEFSRSPYMKKAESLGANWVNDPELAQVWLQMIADHGGDYRQTDKYYNYVTLPAGQTVYWPGDPARPK